MSMIFCHGCGKQIHETAKSCPQCGASQVGFPTQKATYHWSSITAFVSSIVVFLMAMTEPEGKWDSDSVLGGMILGSIPIAFSLYSFSISENKSRWMAIIGITLGIIVVLASIGSSGFISL